MTRRPRITRESVQAIRDQIMLDLAALRTHCPPEAEEAMVSAETFVAVALELMSLTNPSKLKSVMMTVELRYHMQPTFQPAATEDPK